MNRRSAWRRGARLVPAAVVLVVATGCGGGVTRATQAGPAAVRDGGELTYAAEQEPSGFNVNTSKDSGSAGNNVVEGVLPSVFRIQPDFTVTLDTNLMDGAALTATSPQTVVYRIRPTARWDDGTPISAADFRYLWQHSNGSDPSNDTATTAGYADITSVTGSDDGRTVTVVFRRPFADWRSLFGFLLPAHIMAGLPGGWNTGLDRAVPFSGGPYRLASYTPGQDLTLVRNDRYFGPCPHLDRIRFRFLADSATQVTALANGEVQLIYPQPQRDDAARIRASPGVSTQTSLGLWFEHVDFNLAVPGLDDLAVRRAIALAMDRDQIVAATVGGINRAVRPLGNRMWLTGQPQYEDHSGPYGKGDVAGARRLLEQAGYAAGPDGVYAKAGRRLSFRFTTTAGNRLREDQGVLLQGQLRRAGIELRMDNIAATQFFADRITKGDFDIADYAWTGAPFAVSANTSIWVSRGGQNFTGYANPTVDRLFAQANAALDEATAVRLSKTKSTDSCGRTWSASRSTRSPPCSPSPTATPTSATTRRAKGRSSTSANGACGR